MRLIGALSALVASGQGQKCSGVLGAVREYLLAPYSSSASRINILKSGRANNPVEFGEVAKELLQVVSPFIENVDEKYLTEKPPIRNIKDYN